MPKYFKVVWHSARLNTTSHSYDEWWRPPFWLSQHCCLYWSVHGIINCESVLKQTWITFNYILKKNPKKPSTRNSYSLTLPICSTHTLIHSTLKNIGCIFFFFILSTSWILFIHREFVFRSESESCMAASAMFLVSEFSLYSSECLTTCWQKTRSSPYWCLQYLNTGTSVHIKISTICIPHHLSLK